MMKRTDLQNYKGFTLIELLVTISIIAVLAAILFPVFARARESARRASCMSNLKQIGLGVMMYTQDFDERYPFGVTLDDVNWYEAVSPYTSPYGPRTQIYRCPSSYLKLQGGAHSDFSKGNYGANQAMFVNAGAGRQSLSIASLGRASTTYMIMDAGSLRIGSRAAETPTDSKLAYLPGTGPGTADNFSDADWNSSYLELKADYASGRHFGGINMLFADGHVKWLKSHKAVTEAIPCGGSSCYPDSGKAKTAKSAWNPLLGGPASSQ